MHGFVSYRRFGNVRSLRSDRAVCVLGRYVATEPCACSVATYRPSRVRARSLRSDRALTRARSLRSDRALARTWLLRSDRTACMRGNYATVELG
ncbi:hypothetical protein F2Q70_00002990 [Brassica cretica]|uniref:Uncharacterized protein n=1 Tax=Brassica cretica TaxID=69181 RepID=A0A8S9IZS2_BRACR|nr:hypothetical protein F2Q70_00002990 [Brassica cretica]